MWSEACLVPCHACFRVATVVVSETRESTYHLWITHGEIHERNVHRSYGGQFVRQRFPLFTNVAFFVLRSVMHRLERRKRARLENL
jgi:hypothetical protein